LQILQNKGLYFFDGTHVQGALLTYSFDTEKSDMSIDLSLFNSLLVNLVAASFSCAASLLLCSSQYYL